MKRPWVRCATLCRRVVAVLEHAAFGYSELLHSGVTPYRQCFVLSFLGVTRGQRPKPKSRLYGITML